MEGNVKIYVCIGIIQIYLLTFLNGQLTSCFKGCTCSNKYRWSRYSPRNIDCSYRNLKAIPSGPVRYGDYLNLRGNQIKTIKHNEFDRFRYLKGVDLRDNPIENIPSAVFIKMTYLNELLISAKKIHHFAFHGLTSLRILRIDGTMDLQQLHVTLLKPLTNLRNLTVTNTKINTIVTHAIAGMKFLDVVDLRNNQIKGLGNDAFQGSPSLKTLYLSNNKLTKIPSNIRGHSKLTLLDASSNQITSIDGDAFNGLNSLLTLDLSNNKLSRLEDNIFSGASKLQTVKLQGNDFETVPMALLPSKCGSLRQLDLSYNKITNYEFPSATTRCLNLNTLKLRGNPLTKINVGGLTRLSTLDISKNCNLNYTASTLSLSRRLRSIDLSESCLDKLPGYFQTSSRYSTIYSLNLHGNKFKNFTMTFQIYNLNISSNELEEIALYSRYYSRYGTYDLSDNKLSTLKKTSTSFNRATFAKLILRKNLFNTFHQFTWLRYQTLDLSYNNIQTFDSGDFGYTQRYWLRKLYLRGNRLTKISNSTLFGYRLLNIVDLSENRIDSIAPNAFSNYFYLKEIYLVANKFTAIPTEISKLVNLEKLDLSNNTISVMNEDTFNQMKKLKQITVKHNRLETLPMALTKFTESYQSSVVFDVTGNNLRCSCDIKVMLSYRQKIQPIGSCKDSSGSRALTTLITSSEELLKSKCNLCPLSPCKFRGKCVQNETVGFQCNCHEGFSGRLCEVANVDCPNDTCSICKATTCSNGGTCIEDNGKATCKCPIGYSGSRCYAASCDPSPCRNNGTCFLKGYTTFKCNCPSTYYGETCQLYHGYCDSKTCNNRGLCIKGLKPPCICNNGYTGDNCELKGKAPTSGQSIGGSGNRSKEKKSITSSNIAVVILVLLLAFMIVVVGFMVHKHEYIRSCKKEKKDDKVDLSQHF